MQLKRLITFKERLTAHEPFSDLTDNFFLYYKYDGKWYGTSDPSSPIEDEELIKNLEKTIFDDEHWRGRNSVWCWFPVTEFSAVVCASFQVLVKAAKRKSVYGLICDCVQNAINDFDASHDARTGLLNAQALDREIDLILGDLNKDEGLEIEASLGARHEALAILAADIDNFKQINDTYGHNYGDLVISCLAKRLQKVCDEVVIASEQGVHAILARPSGDEFLVCVHGEMGERTLLKLADRMRAAIGDSELPSEEELRRENVEEDSQAYTMPPLRERRATISIGISSILTRAKDEFSKLRKELREEADRALLIAKRSGRDRTRLFSEILDKSGTVIEHHQETDIVAIDIGRVVKVRQGQEFRVIHPDFTGEKPFTVSDGRTTRQLGTYPEAEIGQIIVFDVQSEVSFCRVAKNVSRKLFPNDSALKAIPLGSIAHLVEDDPRPGIDSFSTMLSAKDFAASVKASADSGERVGVVVFKIIDQDDLFEKLGNALINQALAELYKAIGDSLGRAIPISFTERTAIGIGLPGEQPSESMETLVRQICDKASRRCKEVVKFAAGVYVDELSGTYEEKNGRSVLQPERGLDYARYAAINAQKTRNAYELFTPNTCHLWLYSLRQDSQFEQALADHKIFRDMGIDNAFVENQAAICEFNCHGSELDSILEKATRAIELGPDDPVLHTNMLQYYWQYEDYQNVVDVFDDIAARFPDFAVPNIIRAKDALSYAKLHEANPSKLTLEAARAQIIAARSCYDDDEASKWKDSLDVALFELDVSDV